MYARGALRRSHSALLEKPKGRFLRGSRGKTCTFNSLLSCSNTWAKQPRHTSPVSLGGARTSIIQCVTDGGFGHREIPLCSRGSSQHGTAFRRGGGGGHCDPLGLYSLRHPISGSRSSLGSAFSAYPSTSSCSPAGIFSPTAAYITYSAVLLTVLSNLVFLLSRLRRRCLLCLWYEFYAGLPHQGPPCKCRSLLNGMNGLVPSLLRQSLSQGLHFLLLAWL